jgi:oligosaccharide reducing-end xylanase
MKTKFVIASFMLIFSIKANSQNVKTPYEVATWYGFRSSAITYTFDDGTAKQFTVAAPLLDKYGYKATFFTIASWIKDWNTMRILVANGHEIANHTLTHPNLGALTINQQKAELQACNDSIEQHIPHYKVRTMAYPYCATGSDSLMHQYFIASRICSGVIEPQTPAHFMAISSLGCGNLSGINSSAALNQKADEAAAAKGWVVYLLHGIDDDGGYSPIASASLDSSLRYLSSNPEKFWVETFGNVARYIRERNSVSVLEVSKNKNVIKINVSDTLNNEIYNYPLSIRCPLPENWTSAKVLQNGKQVLDSICEVNSVKYIVFHAVPDAGVVSLKRE